jgi:peptidoglycan/LPS O-acetylase OafA/YrhL
LSPPAVGLGALTSVVLFCGCSFFKPVGTFTLLVQCATAAVLVGLVAYRGEAALFTVLDHAIVRFYGKISYSFYLLHPLALWSANWVTVELLKQFDSLPAHSVRIFCRRHHAAGLCLVALRRMAGHEQATIAGQAAV